MPQKFEIEYVLGNKKEGYCLIARWLTPDEHFSVAETSFLNGVEIKSSMSNVRAAYEDGTPRSDLFVFYLRFKKDVNQFKAKMIVELTNRQ